MNEVVDTATYKMALQVGVCTRRWVNNATRYVDGQVYSSETYDNTSDT